MSKRGKKLMERPLQVELYGVRCPVEDFPEEIKEGDDRYVIHDGIVCERIEPENFQIDVTKIPDYVRDDLARMAIELCEEYFKQPGAEEKYQRWLKERNATSKISPSVSP